MSFYCLPYNGLCRHSLLTGVQSRYYFSALANSRFPAQPLEPLSLSVRQLRMPRAVQSIQQDYEPGFDGDREDGLFCFRRRSKRFTR